MDHEQFDILLSAYLDGELTATEQVRVEQLLASSPEARQLIEELRALRAGLQALPQHQLEANFADRVLQLPKVERAESEGTAGDRSRGIELDAHLALPLRAYLDDNCLNENLDARRI